MKTDSLNRRLRFAPSQPIDKIISLRERDLLVFETLDRHGPLPANYMFEATRHICRDRTELQHRLCKLFNGTTDGVRYLTRPEQQRQNFEARYQPLIYDLSLRAKRVLAERGLLARYSPERTDHFVHRLMGACVSLSIELTAKSLKIRYISREEILAGPKCPESTKNSPNPLAISVSSYERKSVVPDDLFGLEYPNGGGFAFFALENDRGTESIERKGLEHATIAGKIRGYLDIIGRKTYRSQWGIPNLRILFVTTSIGHSQNILGYLKQHRDLMLSEKFLLRVDPHFGTNWRVPRSILNGLLCERWDRVCGSADIGRP